MLNDSNQYADHMGLELLALSALVDRTATGEESLEKAPDSLAAIR